MVDEKLLYYESGGKEFNWNEKGTTCLSTLIIPIKTHTKLYKLSKKIDRHRNIIASYILYIIMDRIDNDDNLKREIVDGCTKKFKENP